MGGGGICEGAGSALIRPDLNLIVSANDEGSPGDEVAREWVGGRIVAWTGIPNPMCNEVALGRLASSHYAHLS